MDVTETRLHTLLAAYEDVERHVGELAFAHLSMLRALAYQMKQDVENEWEHRDHDR